MHSTFVIYNPEDWAKIQARIKLSNMKQQDFLWEAAKHFNPRGKLSDGMLQYLDTKVLPKDPFNMKQWEEFIDCEENLQKVRDLVGKLDKLWLRNRNKFIK